MLYNIQEIMKRLPHRYPMLLIDRVLHADARSVTAIKNVTINEPFFTGHFPENPVMPGVLIIDALTQASAFIDSVCIEQPDFAYLAAVDQARFKHPVIPGDQLILKVSVLTKRDRLMQFTGQGYVDGLLVAEAKITTILGT